MIKTVFDGSTRTFEIRCATKPLRVFFSVFRIDSIEKEHRSIMRMHAFF